MSQYIDIEALNQQIGIESRFVDALLGNQSKIIVGQRHMMSRLLIGLLTRGHILLEGLPGLAKTLAIKTLANSVSASFSRIQFTPDLLPADIVGTPIYTPDQKFVKAPFLHISSLLMKSIALLQRFSQHYWRPCRKDK